jgi:hypothetical protein
MSAPAEDMGVEVVDVSYLWGLLTQRDPMLQAMHEQIVAW